MTGVKGRPWPGISDTYRRLIEHNWDMQPMLSLVNSIAASRYADGIFAVTSLSTLCVGQTPEFEMDRHCLRVDFKNDRFVFRYIESSFRGAAWQKECGRNEGFSTFEHVIGRLKWFIGE